MMPAGPYRAGWEDGHEVGYLAGVRAAWDTAFRLTTEQLGQPDPRTVIQPQPRPAATRARGLTGPQLVAGARWSWHLVERQIAAQTDRPASSFTAGGRATTGGHSPPHRLGAASHPVPSPT